ncbi:ATP-binding SpoIIE family protein phosphatase [Amycolatopsis pigmentata]|uniref:SpoIIE family protein phosphatase n=1 Tax=Amycolatopsis pigmentata TaxID=450801 RepID=A0ABW5G1Z9_9PSEU
MVREVSAEDRLKLIGFASDDAIAHLEGQDMLDEVLEGVRRVLRVDTAVILLLQPDARELVATAALGIEPEVRQGVRVPLGRGFAGSIAATGKPVVLERIDETTVVNQLLWEKGIQTLLGVPLIVGGDVLGVLHVGTFRPHKFTDEDIELLQLAGGRIALTVQVQRSHALRAAAGELQRSLLPTRLPSVPFLDMGARYVPGGRANVAGDWYDVFTLPSGWLGVVIGDVVGHDLPAAVVMGRLRSALRAYALDASDPAEVLTRLDRMAQHFEPGIMATVLYGMLEPGFERIHLSSAGHLAPVLAFPDRPAVMPDLPVDTPIGALRGVVRHTTAVEMGPGSLVCFYTDGLVERRRSSLDSGLGRLREVVRTGPANVVAANVMAELVGDEVPEDDIALLVVRRQDAAEVGPLDVVTPAVPEVLKDIRAAIRRWLTAVGADQDALADVLLATGEACTNVVEHAYGAAGGDVALHLERVGPDVVATVRDKGGWRSPRGTNRGRGIMLMRQCCDEVRVDRTEEGTEVVIRRNLNHEREQ